MGVSALGGIQTPRYPHFVPLCLNARTGKDTLIVERAHGGTAANIVPGYEPVEKVRGECRRAVS